MISERKALNTLIGALMRDLLRLQERIVRQQLFGKDSISDPVVLYFERDDYNTLSAEHAEKVAEIRRLKAIADAATDQDIADFVRSRKWAT